MQKFTSDTFQTVGSGPDMRRTSLSLYISVLCIVLLGLCHRPVPLVAMWQDEDALPPEFHQRNRERFIQHMPDSAVALFFAADVKNRSNDVNYLYRQDNSLYYLSGLREPAGVLMLFKYPISVGTTTTQELLFVQPRNPKEEIWTGRRLGKEGAKDILKLAATETVDYFEIFLDKFFKEEKARFKVVMFPYHPTSRSFPEAQRKAELRFRAEGFTVQNALPILAKLRVTKSPEEIRLIRKAVEIAMAAHMQAIMSCEPNMYEYELAAVAEYVFKKMGCEYTAYPSIVGAGENSVILHYDATRKKMQDGELVVMDMGGEYRGYAADITRTIPVNGKFSDAQRQIYELVLAAQTAAIAECKPGAPFHAPHLKAVEVIAEGLLKLGLIRERKDYHLYFMHGTSHHVGLDVHDPSTGVLAENQIITVEPGIYIAEGSPCDKKWWNIGVRIEDMVLITKDGCVVLSGALPKTAQELEALMQKKGIGNLSIQLQP